LQGASKIPKDHMISDVVNIILVVLLPNAARSVTVTVTKAITIIWQCMCCCNTGAHLRHCVEADSYSNGIDSIPCHPTHSKRPYNKELGIYRHAAGENGVLLRHNYCRQLGKANFYEIFLFF